MKMIKANYHTHTYRCHHARGEDFEYVEAAIKAGFKTLGFSDHSPYVGIGNGHAMEPEDLSAYTLSLLNLKERYGNKIDIRIGLEAEYYPEFFEKTLENILNSNIEYMILGQHSMYYDSDYATHITEYEDCEQYVSRVTEAINTGLFSYVAHPDIFGLDRKDSRFLKLLDKICTSAADNDMPVEINLLGLWDGRIYPGEEYLKYLGETGAKTIIGVDAHSPDRFLDKEVFKRAFELCDRFNINLTEEIDTNRLAKYKAK